MLRQLVILTSIASTLGSPAFRGSDLLSVHDNPVVPLNPMDAFNGGESTISIPIPMLPLVLLPPALFSGSDSQPESGGSLGYDEIEDTIKCDKETGKCTQTIVRTFINPGSDLEIASVPTLSP
ncbi:hypothetical protein THRCLA_20008 [Thraustotheca clavata]|uniref:Secreted protein n=1 Tax=Thraustotheca clavata TaxID=74557 RepID=A0A1W0ACI6_9STRA|nr:hypothetical protein THRCLA_20008 [Thraustotheca clavata]